LISLFDLDADELATILEIAIQLKKLHQAGERPNLLPRTVLAMLFEKPSLRTRVSFEAGMAQLGGTALFLGQEVGWQKRESTADFTRVLAQYADVLVCRAKQHSSVEELASFNAVPVINGLTDRFHPCQALADLLTIRDVHTQLAGQQLTFVGDGNNVSRSLALASAMTGIRFRLLGPEAYFLDEQSIESIVARYPDADIAQTDSIAEAMADADFVYTDVWASMGQEDEAEIRQRDFANYQVNSKLMRVAPQKCKILHCLPAQRGQEITDDVIDGANSMIIEQAGNRMHAQKGLLVWMALQHQQLSTQQLSEAGIQLPKP
jgi:ornithine carbamoyltransferase